MGPHLDVNEAKICHVNSSFEEVLDKCIFVLNRYQSLRLIRNSITFRAIWKKIDPRFILTLVKSPSLRASDFEKRQNEPPSIFPKLYS